MMDSNLKLKIISVNINSIVSNERRLALASLLKNHKPQICFLSETVLSKRHKPSFEGYNIIRNDDGRGTAVVTDEKLKFNKFLFHSDIFSACLGVLICRNNFGTTKRILVGSIYIPSNSGQGLHAELDRLNTIVGTFDAAILGGDFNARHPS